MGTEGKGDGDPYNSLSFPLSSLSRRAKAQRVGGKSRSDIKTVEFLQGSTVLERTKILLRAHCKI